MEDRRVLRAARLCLLGYLGKMRPISGLEAAFQFLFLISSLKHGPLAFIHKHQERASPPEHSGVNTHANTHMLTHEAPSGADSVLARLPYLFGS